MKKDHPFGLDQTDYLNGKFAYQTEVQIKIRIRPDVNPKHEVVSAN